MDFSRADIVAYARSLLGTPFHHAERQPGIAIDCAGVLICCAREFGIVEQEFDVPQYLPMPDGRTLLAWCRQYMGAPVAKADLHPGHALVAAIDERPQHLGIVADYKYGGLSLIHASNDPRHMRVIETRLMFSGVLKYKAAFSFPGVD